MSAHAMESRRRMPPDSAAAARLATPASPTFISIPCTWVCVFVKGKNKNRRGLQLSVCMHFYFYSVSLACED